MALADHVRERGRRERERDGRAATVRHDRQQVAHGPVTINVHAQPHHDERRIAAAVHERFNENMRSQLRDGLYSG